MRYWPKRLSHALALFAGVAVAGELASLELEHRKTLRLSLQWRQQLRQSEQLAKASPSCTPESERAMTEAVLQWQRTVAALRAELFSQPNYGAGEGDSDERIDAYFDVAALIVRLRAAAARANVIVKRDEDFGFGAYANEAPPVADMPRLRLQSLIAETILECLFSARPQELLAVRRESAAANSKAANRQPSDYFALERGLSLREGGDVQATAFRVEFTGETASLREFLAALVQTGELLVVRSIDVMPAGGIKTMRAAAKESAGGPIARHTLSRFTVTVEAIRPPGIADRLP